MRNNYAMTGYPMRVHVAPNSLAARAYWATMSLPGQTWRMPSAIAPGVNPAPLEDLIFHGGKTVSQMEFQNIYVGQSSDWVASDMANIDAAILLAMQDAKLNNVVQQYFPGGPSPQCSSRTSFVVESAKPNRMDEPDVQSLVLSLLANGGIADQNLDTAIFNLILPRGTELALGRVSSLHGLGGYHGSVHVSQAGRRRTIYYSANVFSEGENGISVFDQPWKNITGTLYHELNEFRTDADVNDAIQFNMDDFLGWMSRRGEECGDQPIRANGNALQRIFQAVSSGSGKTYVQFLYSNAVHGAEGPIAAPH